MSRIDMVSVVEFSIYLFTYLNAVDLSIGKVFEKARLLSIICYQQLLFIPSIVITTIYHLT